MRFIVEKGQSLFEVVIALAVSALIITGVVSVATNSIQNSAYARDKTLASNYVQETMEWLRSERDKNANTFLTHAQSGTWCFLNLSDWNPPNHAGGCLPSEYISGSSKFKRQAIFSVSVVNGKSLVEVDTTVSWSDSKGLHSVTSSTNLSASQ
jgi:Tfp pilus assembly protein PilV